MSPSALVILVLVGAVTAQPHKRCADIKPAEINYDFLIQLSPLFIYRSTEEIYNCAQVSYVGPAGNSRDYSGTTVVILGNKTLSYDVNLVNNSVFQSTQCSDGLKGSYKVLLSNLNIRDSSSYCVYTCDENGDKIEFVACKGRTSQDDDYIDNYLTNILDVQIAKPVLQSQADCPRPQYCHSFG